MLRSLSNYEMRSVTRRTASGVTHEGWDPVQARKVTITIVPCRDADEPARLAWAGFLGDLTAAAALNHRNVARILDHGESGRTAYAVTEWVDGHPLETLLTGGARPVRDGVAVIMDGLLAGLQHSHDHGLVHGDINPSSILLTAEGTPVITGFGVARLKRDDMGRPGAAADAAAYMSPEQVRGAAPDPSADIYAAGAVLHQMLLGRLPFEGRTAPLAQEVVSARLVLPSSGLDDVPGLAAVLTRALAKLPSERYGSAQDFARALRASFSLASAVAPRQPAVLSDLQTLLTRPDPDAALPAAEAGTATGARKGGRSGLLVIPALAAVAGLAALGWWASGQKAPALQTAAQATLAPLSDPAPGPADAGAAPAPTDVPGGPALMPYAPARARPAVPAAPAAATDAGGTLAASLNEAASAMPCTLLLADAGPDGVAVRGLTALGDASRTEVQGALRRVAAQAASAPAVTWDIRRLDGPQCGVLDTLRGARGAAAPAAVPMLSLSGDAAPATLRIAVPPGKAALLDLFGTDRSVTHLKLAGEGDASIEVPRGPGLITLVVSPTPLIAGGRPPQEQAAAYLADLRAGLARARKADERVTAEALPLEARP